MRLNRSHMCPIWHHKMNFETQYITIEDVLRQARILIPYNEARILLQDILKVNHAYLITHPEQSLPPIQIYTFQLLVKRRTSGEPIAYILGECEFYSIKFEVTPSVLIPRPETELLVDLALEKISLDMPCKILDLGTGSGAVAITIAKHRVLSIVTAVDNSVDAIAVAKKNVQYLNVNNIHIIKSDWFGELTEEHFDFIISNPPYIASDDPHLNQGDLRFEPELALVAGQNGMDCIQTIVSSATSHLNIGGWLLLEHGYNQAEISRQLLKEAGFSNIFSRSDLAGIMRISGGRYEPSLKSC
jgi:release factor glutamine methyltransferase